MKLPKICHHCGNTFIAQTTVTKFCGDLCAKRNYKKRAKEAKIKASLDETLSQLTSSPTVVATAPLQKDYLCINDLSKLLGVSRQTIWRMADRGQLNMKQVGRKKLISRRHLEAFFQ
jgi:excisionase family DNA binding protein